MGVPPVSRDQDGGPSMTRSRVGGSSNDKMCYWGGPSKTFHHTGAPLGGGVVSMMRSRVGPQYDEMGGGPTQPQEFINFASFSAE